MPPEPPLMSTDSRTDHRWHLTTDKHWISGVMKCGIEKKISQMMIVLKLIGSGACECHLEFVIFRLISAIYSLLLSL